MHDYMPVIRLHKGEVSALAKVVEQKRARILPLVEIAPIRLPLDDQEAKCKLTVRLQRHARELSRATIEERVLVDTELVDTYSGTLIGRPAVEVLSESQGFRRHFVPVTRFRDAEHDEAVASISRSDQLGLGLRLTPADVISNSFMDKVLSFMARAGCEIEDTDLIIDFGTVDSDLNYLEVSGNKVLRNAWRSVTVAGGSFPSPTEISSREIGAHRFVREELSAWRRFHMYEGDSARHIAYGDYVVEHPTYDVPPTGCIPTASIRYTLEDSWFFIKGARINNPTYGGSKQWLINASVLCGLPEFRGPSFSSGDEFIFRKGNGETRPGKPTTWRQAAVSHHIAQVLEQIAPTLPIPRLDRPSATSRERRKSTVTSTNTTRNA